MANFSLTQNLYADGAKGFVLTFDNGWLVSVQFGAGNYCSNSSHSNHGTIKDSETAEIAALDKNGVWYDFGHDNVKGHVLPNEVAEFMAMIAGKD